MSGAGYPRHLSEHTRAMRAAAAERDPVEVKAPTLAMFVLTALGDPSDRGKPARLSGDLRDRLVELARNEVSR